MPKKKAKPEKKMVMIHSCFDIELGDKLPSLCACNLLKTITETQGMVGRNEAEWVKGTDHRHACLIGGMARRTPRSATIDDKHIERAYVECDLEEKTRINEYGKLNSDFIKSLRLFVQATKFDEIKKQNIDIPVIQNNDDNRTVGGFTEERK